jgi:tetratricopeptide (TPR) repeat protein
MCRSWETSSQSRRRFADAVPLAERAYRIYMASVGPDHPFMTRGLLPMADIHLERAEYAEAESLYRRALVIEKATLRGDAPAAVEAIAETNSSLAYLFAIQGKFGEAAEFAVQAVEMSKRV